MVGEWTTIGEIAEIFDGPHATPEKIDNGPYFLSISSLENGKLDLSKSARVSEEQFKKWTKRVTPRKGDVLFSYETRLGEAAMMPEGVRACLGRRMGLLRPDTQKIDPRFLLFTYLGPDFQRQIRARTNSGATVDRIALKELPDFPIWVPPLSEQKSIAHILGSLDDKIELKRQMNATLESMAQALFKSWFVDFDPVIDNALAVGSPIPEPMQDRAESRATLDDRRNPLPEAIQKLFPSRFDFIEEFGWIPEGWKVRPFGDLIDLTIGGDWGKEESDEEHSVYVTIIRGTDIPNVKAGTRGSAPCRWIEPKKYKSRALQDGDIVLEVSGGSPKQPTGRSVYITQNNLNLFGGLVVPASFCRKFRPISSALGLYGALHLDRIYAAGKMWGYQNQSTGISNFQTAIFLDLELIVLPDKSSILEVFFKFARPILDKITTHEQEHLASIRDTLLPKLLSGQLRIPEAEKLMADAL